MSKIITLTVDSTLVEQIKNHYSSFEVEAKGEYVSFMAKVSGTIITIYSSKKERIKVVFSGDNAYLEAKKWDETIEEPKESKSVKEKAGWICLDDQIGSDEVGVGDFLGPMIVVAAYVSKKDIPVLKEYGIQDSKKMTDKRILEVGDFLAKHFKFSKLTLSNQKYNEMLDKGENLNSMKAKMHNRALLNMKKKYEKVSNVFVDQFVQEETYYKYLNDENEEQVKDIYFKTKGESYFPSVALASVIARYSYLKEMELLSKKYKMEFPFGASKKVTDFAKKFLKKYGEKELYKIAKKNFANYNEVLNS